MGKGAKSQKLVKGGKAKSMHNQRLVLYVPSYIYLAVGSDVYSPNKSPAVIQAIFPLLPYIPT